jgi:hypothetical protein
MILLYRLGLIAESPNFYLRTLNPYPKFTYDLAIVASSSYLGVLLNFINSF